MNLTREQLYNLVWEKPLSFFIESYGGTYQEVKDLLKKYNIPSPENGYWSRIRAGNSIAKPFLPSHVVSNSGIVNYEPKEKKKRIKSNDTANVIQGIRKVGKLDELVIEAKKAFQNQSKGKGGSMVGNIVF